MNAVGKNLKALRQRAGPDPGRPGGAAPCDPAGSLLLGDRKTQPDIETLTALAEGPGRRRPELIYGPEQAERPYTRFQRRYIVCAVVCILAFLVWCVLELTLVPYLSEQLLRKGYLFWPSYVYGITGALFVYTAAGVFLPAAISLWRDIRLQPRWLRQMLVVLGALLLAHYVLWAVVPPAGECRVPASAGLVLF